MDLKTILNYNSSSYFNGTDHFLFYIPSGNRYLVSKVENYNGSWYTVLGLNYKVTSILSINADKHLNGVEVLYKGTYLQGELGDTAIDGNLKVWWKPNQSEAFKKWFPYVWNDPKNLVLNPRKEILRTSSSSQRKEVEELHKKLKELQTYINSKNNDEIYF